jgi:hypothetical protein
MRNSDKYAQSSVADDEHLNMRSSKFTILPAPEILKNDVECFRIAEYAGEEGLAIKVCLNGMPGIVFQHNKGQSPIENIITPSRCNFY